MAQLEWVCWYEQEPAPFTLEVVQPALLCFQTTFHGALEGVQSPLLEGVAPPLQVFPGFSSIRNSLYSHWILYYIERGREKGRRGGAPPKHLTKANTQQYNFSCWVPRRQEPPWPSWYSASAPLPGLPQLCSWCSFTFSANNLQMYLSSLWLTTPTLKDRGERRKRTSHDCVWFGRLSRRPHRLLSQRKAHFN